jgi:hypothetical protein
MLDKRRSFIIKKYFTKFTLSVSMRQKSKIILLSLFFTSIYFATFKIIQNYVFEFTIARYKLVNTPQHNLNSKKVILFWNDFFNYDYWQMPNETNYDEYLKSLNCSMKNCVLTHKKDFLGSLNLFDATVFHGAES